MTTPIINNGFLAAVNKIISQRAERYGGVDTNFDRIARLWGVVLQKDVTPEEVVLCMILLKVVRLSHNPMCKDSMLDIAGYAACYADGFCDWSENVTNEEA